MRILRHVLAAALLAILALACCLPVGESDDTRDPAPAAQTGPAPWVPTLAELAADPSKRPSTQTSGTRFETYDYEIEGLAVPSLMVSRDSDPEIKWFLLGLGSELPEPGLFGPPGAVRSLARERVGLVHRELYEVTGGPLTSWFVVVDRSDGKAEQIHVANRRYLLANQARIAQAGGVR